MSKPVRTFRATSTTPAGEVQSPPLRSEREMKAYLRRWQPTVHAQFPDANIGILVEEWVPEDLRWKRYTNVVVKARKQTKK